MADVRYAFCTQCYGTGSRLNGAMCDACKGAGRVPVQDGPEEEEKEESRNSQIPI
jgi:DnaJ-class molecular chaperone